MNVTGETVQNFMSMSSSDTTSHQTRRLYCCVSLRFISRRWLAKALPAVKRPHINKVLVLHKVVTHADMNERTRVAVCSDAFQYSLATHDGILEECSQTHKAVFLVRKKCSRQMGNKITCHLHGEVFRFHLTYQFFFMRRLVVEMMTASWLPTVTVHQDKLSSNLILATSLY